MIEKSAALVPQLLLYWGPVSFEVQHKHMVERSAIGSIGSCDMHAQSLIDTSSNLYLCKAPYKHSVLFAMFNSTYYCCITSLHLIRLPRCTYTLLRVPIVGLPTGS